jgi:hypothetical protein
VIINAFGAWCCLRSAARIRGELGELRA